MRPAVVVPAAPTAARRGRVLRTGSGLLALLIATVACGAAAAAVTIWGGGLVGPAAMQGSARGTALVLLSLAVPVIAVSTALAWGGSNRAVVTATGAVGYVSYNAVLLLFLTPFNRYFLLYVAAFSAATWALVVLLRSSDPSALAAATSRLRHPRLLAGYLLVVVALNALAWLRPIAASVTADDPADVLAGTGVMTNATWIQDLAIWLPAAAVGAVWLWRRDPRGYLVSAAILVFWVIESVGIAVDQWVGGSADPGSPVVSTSAVPAFVVLALVNLAVAACLLVPMRGGVPDAETRATGA